MTRKKLEHPMDKYLRPGRIPHIWCPGCGLGTVLACYITALENAGIDLDKTAIVSGIGCTGRAAGYLYVDSYHTTHGRPIPFATGLKLANPELIVTVFSGDGDLFAIGGNHLIQAARRNLDVTVILVNNLNFAMTGGQVAPTTPVELRTSTTPYGNREKPFDLCKLVIAAGATFVSRWSTAKPMRAIKAIKGALQHDGFSMVEVVCQCPTILVAKRFPPVSPSGCSNGSRTVR